MMYVIKRDGRRKPFDSDRIKNAVESAFVDCYEEDNYTLNRSSSKIVNILTNVYEKINSIKDEGRNYIDIEEVQDIVIDCIKREDEAVSLLYKEFRENRDIERDKKSKLLKEIVGIMDQTNAEVLNENANKQGQLLSTQRDLIAGEVSKYISKTSMIPGYIMDAHYNGAIKIHDLDYFAMPMYNCELVNIKDMLQNGTVINKKKINRPKSLRTAMTLVTQIAAQVSSSTYGGQTISLSHIAPFVRVSEEKIRKKYSDSRYIFATRADRESAIQQELREEIKDSVQTFNYQVSTLMTTNGQSPFISVCMYIDEDIEYREETVMLIEEFLKQRISGMENEHGVVTTQTFPKLLYFLDENNAYEGSEYFWLTKLAAVSTSKRMNPDYISVKKMKEVVGYAFPPMGCRAFLSPFMDSEGNPIFYGRGNLGVCSINLPYVALESNGDFDKFWTTLDKYLDMARRVGEIRYNKLRGTKAKVAPILWQHGAISRLKADDCISKAIDDRGFTVTIGYSGIYETIKYLVGVSHTNPTGLFIARKIMKYMKDACEKFKDDDPRLRFALYGTPQESTTGWFHDKLKNKFGVIKDITDKGWITNSYHVDIREDIDAFTKLDIESKLQYYSTGGAVSYVETTNLDKNPKAVLEIAQHIYETIMYAEINFESDTCGKCKYNGVMSIDNKSLKWYCPQCGNSDQDTLSVIRRTCGYLGETEWTDGRKKDIINRVKHL